MPETEAQHNRRVGRELARINRLRADDIRRARVARQLAAEENRKNHAEEYERHLAEPAFSVRLDGGLVTVTYRMVQLVRDALSESRTIYDDDMPSTEAMVLAVLLMLRHAKVKFYVESD